MSCNGIEQRMMDVLYGEALDSRECFAFFRHLQECPACRREYDELVGTRRALSEWQVDNLPEDALTPVIEKWEGHRPASKQPTRPPYWTWLQRSAAALLMVLGLWTLLAQAGVAPMWSDPSRLALSEAELDQIVQEKAARLVAEEVYSIQRELQTHLENFQNQLKYVEQNSDEQKRELLEAMQDKQERFSSGT